MRVLITGGAGFVGSNIAQAFQSDPLTEVTIFDNLRRRGSELNLAVFRRCGIDFVHGDVRNPDDFEDLSGNFDLLIDASSEPSVHAGMHGSPANVIRINLFGTVNCMEFARKRAGQVIFLSTSRV